MIHRSHNSRSGVVHRFPRVRKEKYVTKKKNLVEEKDNKINGSKKFAFEYSKIALNFMFIANGGGATAILVNMDMYKYLIPLTLFSIGIVISILSTSAFIFYFLLDIKECKNKILKILNMTTSFLYIFVFLSPCIIFIFGIFTMKYIVTIENDPTLCELLKWLWQ